MKKNKEFKPKSKILFSKEYKKYKRKQSYKKIFILACQILLFIALLVAWELCAKYNIIDSFITSCPSKIWATITTSIKDGTLFYHSWISLSETIIAFLIATILGSLIAIVLWWNETLRKVLEPYIVVLNSLPKIALGPIIIVWFGVGTQAIVVMAILIMIVITIISMLNAFLSCEPNKILLLKSMGASKLQILCKLILPCSVPEFISVLKINVGLAWVGTIMGEYLVSRAGLGYQINYGSQVLDLSLVMANTVVLCVLATAMYLVVAMLEKYVHKKHNRN